MIRLHLSNSEMTTLSLNNEVTIYRNDIVTTDPKVNVYTDHSTQNFSGVWVSEVGTYFDLVRNCNRYFTILTLPKL
jgi:hypothetical protein